MLVEISSYIKGPRWAGLRDLIRTAASHADCVVVAMDSEKSWLKESVYFTLSGEVDGIATFNRMIKESVRAWEEDDD